MGIGANGNSSTSGAAFYAKREAERQALDEWLRTDWTRIREENQQ